MKFLNICLINKTEFKIEDRAGQLICTFLNTFILTYFNDMEYYYTLNIELVTDTSYWGQVKIKNKIVESLELRIELFKDFIVDNIGEDERSQIILHRNNTIFHELIHIRNRLYYDINSMRDFKTITGNKDALIEYMVDEYLAEYESNMVFENPQKYEEEIFVYDVNFILNSDKDKFIQLKEILYNIATLVAHKHLETTNCEGKIIFKEIENISGVYLSMIDIMSRALWYYNLNRNIQMVKYKLRPSFETLSKLINNKRLK